MAIHRLVFTDSTGTCWPLAGFHGPNQHFVEESAR